jgi:hypothetical protein
MERGMIRRRPTLTVFFAAVAFLSVVFATGRVFAQAPGEDVDVVAVDEVAVNRAIDRRASEMLRYELVRRRQ